MNIEKYEGGVISNKCKKEQKRKLFATEEGNLTAKIKKYPLLESEVAMDAI